MVYLDNADTTGNINRSAIDPQSTGHVHPLIQRVASGEVDKVGDGVQVVCLPGHRLVGIGSGPTHGEGELGVGVGKWVGHGFGGGSDGKNLWRIGNLEPENLTLSTAAIGLDQELRGVDLCNKRSIYASRKIMQSGRANAPLPELSQAWYQVTVATGSGGRPGRYVEPRT